MANKKRRAPSHTWVDPKTNALYARYTYTDRFGRERSVRRRAESPAHARAIYQELKAEHKERGEESFDARRMTFKDLAEFAKQHFIKEPVYRDSLKVEGVRSWYDMRNKLDVLVEFFGRMKVREITHADLMAFRSERLQTPTRGDIARHKEALKKDRKAKLVPSRALASVHRELALMRRVLNIAKRQRWIQVNPFDGGGLISGASEKRRDRIIGREEESRMLAACEGRYKHLRPLLVCGFDTGMRSGEMFKLRWRDVDLASRTIRLIAFNTKDAEEREVGMTPRLHAELTALWESSIKDSGALVFGVTNNIKKGWAAVCKLAGVEGAKPHDLRHTCATRMIQAGMPIEEVGRVLGHASPETTYRYINRDATTHSRAAEALHKYLESDHDEPSDAVN
jgi:integrase